MAKSKNIFEKVTNIIRGIAFTFSSLENFYRTGAKIITLMVYRSRFIGFENVPETGPVILISNHITYMDGLIIHTACKRPVRYIIEKEIYEVPPVKYFLSMAGAIPIEPTRESVKAALQQVKEAMDQGHVVCIFPEGQLTYTGNMTRFRFGIEWMARESNVPVVPIALKGLWGSIFSRRDINKWHRWLPKTLFRKVVAVCGKPIPTEEVSINHLQRVVMELKNHAETHY